MNDIPYGLAPHIAMCKPNDKIEIYNGDFELQHDNIRITITGSIYYQWRNRSNIIFQGEYVRGGITYNNIKAPFNMYISNKLVGTCYITKSNQISIRGIGNYGLLLGDDNDCDRICFALFNLKNIFGEPIKYSENDSYRNRLTFKDDDFEIIVENRQDYKSIEDSLMFDCDEYYISHYCQITHINEKLFKYSDISDTLQAFKLYLSFMYGKEFNPMIVYGYNKTVKLFERHNNEILPNTAYTRHVASKFEHNCTTENWNNFLRIWQTNKDSKDILNTAIHWYLEANQMSGKCEGAYIMAFAGIELMYNVLVGHKANSTTAKINKLCSYLSIDDEINSGEITNVRNYLMHYGESNRKLYREVSFNDLLNMYNQLMYLLERCILKYIDYSGDIQYRIHTEATIKI